MNNIFERAFNCGKTIRLVSIFALAALVFAIIGFPVVLAIAIGAFLSIWLTAESN